MNHLLVLYTLWRREMVRFFRQPHRVFGALGQPLLFWLLIGGSFNAIFKGPDQMHYLEYIFPGILMMIVLFVTIFSSFSTIEDRKEGFLQSVLVSPASRISIVFGKISGGATLALVQAIIFLCLAPLIGLSLNGLIFLKLVGILFIMAIGLTAFGFLVAWKMESIQGFHSIMMVILMPMWFLSGSFFPVEGSPWIIEWFMKINPLTYGVTLLRFMFGHSTQISFETSLSVIIVFGCTMLFLSWFQVAKR